MKHLAFRLEPGQLLKEEIEQRTKHIPAGVVLSLVGGLQNAVLRMAGATPSSQIIKEVAGPLEIVSGTGTISADGCHIHVSVSDSAGTVIGGHLKNGCRVEFTAEIVIGILENTEFIRADNTVTGFKELHVKSYGH